MIDHFFAFVRERYLIRVRRNEGQPRPWTQDPILQNYSFTEVFREDDRTTKWLRENVRDPLRNDPRVLPAVLIFRWFNRVETGEAIFKKRRNPPANNLSAFDLYMHTGEIDHLRKAIKKHVGDGPVVTGAYTINTRAAGLKLSKLDGVLKQIEMWMASH